MKKVISTFLFLVLLLSTVSCSRSSLGYHKKNELLSSDSLVNSNIYEVIMQYPIVALVPPDLQLVEDAINEKTIPSIGVRIKLLPVDVSSLRSTTNIMVSSGEKLDLVMSMFEGGVGDYVNNGVLIELDDLVERFGADIVEAEEVALSGGYFNEKLYAVPSEEKMGRVKSFLARKDLMDKYNIPYDPNHIYTYEDLSQIFATVKAGEGTDFYCIANNANDESPFHAFDPVDYLGATLASGCLLNYGVGTDTIVNYYETEGFAKACLFARDWYKKGYYSPDCNVVNDYSYMDLCSGNYFGIFSNSEPDMVANMSGGTIEIIGTELVPLYTCEPSARTQFYQTTLWAIPVTCENPEKTMQWLNMMYADKDIINLLYRGIEDVHWEFINGSDCVIRYFESLEGSISPYFTMFNVWGDKMKDYVMYPLDESYYQKMRDFNNSISIQYTSEALGYCFNSEPVKAQFAAVSAVINRYQVSLALGAVDPDTVLPEFLGALEEAGIKTVIAENQRQYDAWKRSQ